MRRDTQIGIILGVVILVVIGIFLSTRTTVYETKTPDLKLSEKEIVAESEIEEVVEIEEIDINDLIKEAKTALAKEDVQSVEELVEKSPVEPSKDSVTLEGKWEGTKTASIEPEEAFSEMPVAETITEEPEIAELTPPEAEETIAVLETKQKDASAKTIHKVKPNDSLFAIARKYYGDEAKWYKIYEVNRDNMSGPNALYIGQELVIPEITLAKKVTLSIETPIMKKQDNEVPIKTTEHTVVSGDTLYHLARKYYDDSTMWQKIYEANEGTIENESFLAEGQILVIPE
jgi:nucleoid-associated protein YgaU